ncbi:MAG TPA: DapH/DapD/GlmU-related protein [Phycisphaerae bacterium]|nr:DapH/DapD/GlmU-related protein [Phycisphaerae bacterium]HRW54595.1 DapH/DapD/GlmU-related protein [Phycisphaerae bacterium]
MSTQNQQVDPTARLAPSVRIDIAPDARLHVGPRVSIADGVMIDIDDEGVIRIDEHVAIAQHVTLRGHGDIHIGAGAVIDAGVVIDTREFVPVTFAPDQPAAVIRRPIRIGPRARIGANAVLRAGVTIGADAVVPPCMFVMRDVPDRAIASPAHTPMDATSETLRSPRRFLFGFCRWHETARHFVTLANTLRAANIDSRIYGTPLTLSRLPRLRTEQAIAHDDSADMERVLDDWRPDVLFVWSGATQVDQALLNAARDRNIECRVAELGWFPQSRTIHFDHEGANARSSIRRLDLSQVRIDPRFDDWLHARRNELAEAAPDIDGYIFVPLQDIRDTNITLASPYDSMDAFVSALAMRFPNETFVVRPHPCFNDVWITPRPNVIVRRDKSIHPWLQHADAVVGINSTALLEALVYGKPSHAVGVGLATGLDVLFEAPDVDALEIHRSIPAERMDRVRRLLSELVFTRQAWTKDLHYLDRLPQIYGLADILSAAPGASPARPAAISARS